MTYRGLIAEPYEYLSVYPGVILETEGSVWKMQKRAPFHYKKVKKAIPNLISHYVHISLQLL